jgi:hypothetical protein
VDRWEHRTVLIRRTAGVWAIQFADGQTLEGIDQVLDEYGSRGWELVTFQPQTWMTEAGQFGPFDVSAWRAVFKRRVPDPAGSSGAAVAAGGAGGGQ